MEACDFRSFKDTVVLKRYDFLKNFDENWTHTRFLLNHSGDRDVIGANNNLKKKIFVFSTTVPRKTS